MNIRRIAALIALTTISFNAQAIPILVVTPSETDTIVGSQVSVDVSITGLLGQFVGDYDLTLAFDDSILSFGNIMFGSFLDGLDDSLQGSAEGAGSVEAFEIAFGPLADQDGFSEFTLFTLDFDVIGEGRTPLELGLLAIGDFFGDPLTVGIESSSLTATRPMTVPEPSTVALVVLALLGLRLSRRRGP